MSDVVPDDAADRVGKGADARHGGYGVGTYRPRKDGDDDQKSAAEN